MAAEKKPLVSVVIAAYNASRFIKDAIDSVLNQTYSNLEIIVVEDGSVDNTLAVLQSFSDVRIKLLLNNKNQGLIYSLNKGLQYAKGEYIARFDADDICRPNRIESQLSFFLSSQADIIGCDIERFGTIKGTAKFPHSDAEIKIHMLFNNPMVHPAIFFHRELIDKGLFRYDEKWKHVEDYELWVRLMDQCRFANIPKVLLKYRTSSQSVCFQNSDEQDLKSDLIRQAVLHKILPGYSCTDLEKKWLKNSNAVKGRQNLAAITGFIKNLVTGNKDHHVFDEHTFSKLLCEKFLSTCLVNNNLRQFAFKLYMQLLKDLSVRKKMEHVLKLFSKGIINEVK